MKNFLILLALVLTMASSAAFAKSSVKEDIPKKDGVWIGDKIKVSGQVRVRPELRNNLTQAIPNVPTNTPTDLSVLLRARFGLLFKPTDQVGFFIQGQDQRDFGEATAATPAPAGDGKNTDLHQGYFDVVLSQIPLTVRGGRQEIKLGEERLVGAADWTNVARAFDAVLLSYQPEKWGLTTFGSITNKTVGNPGDAQYFAGLYSTWKKFPKGVLDGYYFLLQDGDGAAGAAAGTGTTFSLHTVGTRLVQKFDNGIDWGLEAALQMGTFGSNSVLAYAGHAVAGYTFKPDWKPRVGVEYNYASGDNPASARFTKFNNLFPTNHNKYGLMDMTAWSNLHDAAVHFSAKPGKFSVSATYHMLSVDKSTSAGDTFAGFYPGAAGLGKIAGHEMDAQGKWVMNEYFEAGAGYSHFIPGSFLKGQGYNRQSDFFYLSAQAHF